MSTRQPLPAAHVRSQPQSVRPAAVQAHGVLLVLDDDLRIVMCSANTEAMLGVSVDEVLKRPLAAVVGSDLSARVAARRDAEARSEPMAVVLGGAGVGELGGGQVEVRIHSSGLRTVVELEPGVATAAPIGDFRVSRTAMTRLTAAADLLELTAVLAGEIRELTAFDRVMVLRFDHVDEGEVIAESRRGGLASALGRRYRAGESPSGAGHGDALESVHLVADTATQAVALVPALDPGTGAPLDLSHASLRSTVQKYVDPLDATGVTAALSIPIMIDDRLWGVVACHHYAGPLRPGHEIRSAAEFFTQVGSHLVAQRERADARDAAASTKAELSQLNVRLAASSGEVLDALFADPVLLAVFGASGAANLFDGELRTQGRVPDLETMQEISDLLNEPDTYATSTDRLAALDDRFSGLPDVSGGVLRVGTLGDRWGLWFRADGTCWEPWHLEAAEEIGRHVNSLLLLRSREQVVMAESMQRSALMDRAPDYPGVEPVARYRPASTYQLGGDWWDVFELDARRLAFLVGDVAGHGVAAASAMTQVRTALRAYLYEGHGPAGSLDRLDQLMDGLLGVGVATALVAVLDRHTGLVEISSAGHPDPLLVAPDGRAVEVAVARRPMLGVGMGTAPVSVLDLSDGALLLFFTDGLVERRGGDTERQTAQLIDLAAGGISPSPLEDLALWADRVLTLLDTPDDDTTILALRCT